eukprot:4705690-Prymnesium_polylepis.1
MTPAGRSWRRRRCTWSTATVSAIPPRRRPASSPTPHAPHVATSRLCVLGCARVAEARRRLRQVHDALEGIRKAQDRAGGKGGKSDKPNNKGGGKAKGGGGGGGDGGAAAAGGAVVVCGDFNSQGLTGVRELLCAGEVLPPFRESGDPTERNQEENEVTSKPKRQRNGLFFDAHQAAFDEGGGACPPTLVAPTLQPKMADEATGEPSATLLAALDEMFDVLSTDGKTLTPAEQERWLTLINKKVGRGDEFRNAAAARQARGDAPELTRADFVGVYATELSGGKFWGIEHDIRVVRGHGLATAGERPFTARFDYVYATAGALRLHGAQPPLPADRMEALLEGRNQLPNEWFPSDHLPVAVALEWQPPSTLAID